MDISYTIKFRFDLGQAVARVGELANELNDHLSRMGCNEQLAITSELPEMTLTVSRTLTDAEQETVKKIVTKQVQSAFPTWNVQLVCFRRKSGNVQQSASQ